MLTDGEFSKTLVKKKVTKKKVLLINAHDKVSVNFRHAGVDFLCTLYNVSYHRYVTVMTVLI